MAGFAAGDTHYGMETGAATGVVVVLPARDEEAALGPLLAHLAAAGAQAVVVDDGSRDGTARVAASHPGVVLVRHPRSLGLGAALRDGLLAALEHAPECDVVATMDADGTHDPALLPALAAAARAGADVVIASRFAPGGGMRGVGWGRRLLSRGAGLYLRLLAPLPGVRDYSSGYRAYRAAFLRALLARHGAEGLLTAGGFAVQAELLLKSRPLAPRCRELPLLLRYDRKQGPSRMPLAATLAGYLRLARLAAPGPGWALAAALLLALALRLPGLTAPLLDHSSWRQADTAAMARHLLRDGLLPFVPRLDYDGPGPNYAQLELPLLPLAAALLYRAFGMREALARLAALAFFLGSLAFLHALARRHLGAREAAWGALAYAVLPLGIYFGRAVMPEPAMLCLGLGALWAASRWLERPSPARHLAAVLLLALALLAKLPNALLLAPLAALAAARRGRRALLRPSFLALLAVPAAVTVLYYRQAAALAPPAGDFVSGILAGMVLPALPHAWRDPEALSFLRAHLVRDTVTAAGLLPFFLGLLRPRPGEGWLYAWLAADLAYLATAVSAVRLDYYLLPLLPPAALFLGKGLAAIASLGSSRPDRPPPAQAAAPRAPRLRPGTALALALLAAVLWQAWLTVRPLYRVDWDTYRRALALRAALPPGAPLAVGTLNPALLYYSDHPGWRVARLTPRAVEGLRAAGAAFLVPLEAADPATRRYLDARFPRRTAAGLVEYYDLRPRER